MNVYTKLMAARKAFHSQKLKKTGKNSFAKYEYFELGDFLIPALESMAGAGLCAFISFDDALAQMTIVNVDKPEEFLVISSPMSECEMKGLHKVQQLGAVQTYLRRYLWMAALEIVEHDAIEPQTGGTDTGLPLIKTKDFPHFTGESVIFSNDRLAAIEIYRQDIERAFLENNIDACYHLYCEIKDNEEKIELWRLLTSNVRHALKKHNESLKDNK